MTQQFTTTDYLNAIYRELNKRATTYPKIIAKMEKRGDDPADIRDAVWAQTLQTEYLSNVEIILSEPDTFFASVIFEKGLEELKRELKMRKKVYPRMIYFKRITQETADYETAVWTALVEHFSQQKI